MLINAFSPLTPGINYTVDVTPGAFTDLAGNAFNGELHYTFTTAPIQASGTDAGEFIAVPDTGLQIDGGKGIDTALLQGLSYSYTILRNGDKVQAIGKNGVTTTLSGVERLLFADRHPVAVDIDGNGGQAYRLYQAAFDRTPDKAGVGYWIARMDQGASLHDVAQSFIDSDEFHTLYGLAPTDAVFINKLYENVLHRAGEKAGVDYWSGVLANGASRADVLASFSEGAENLAAMAKIIGNGFEYTPYV